MNKTAIKNVAIWARNKLIADITYKAALMGITENGIADPLPQSTSDLQFFDIGTREPYAISGEEIKNRNKLVDLIIDKAKHDKYKTVFSAVIEEVAYTWFNRLIAIRFMEVNDYLPSRVRVLSSDSPNKAEPDLVTTPFEANLSFSDKEKEQIVLLKRDNKLDELFRLLFLKQCNELKNDLPELFDTTNDQSILLTISYTDKEGVVWHLVNDIPEQDFKIRTQTDDEAIARGELKEEDAPAGQVEIIGWLYQYYNTEPKQQVFDLLKKNVKITKERIPAATQLFTPDWIVRYMVENSLGRLWIERHPNDELKKKWKYYLDEAEQEPDVEEQLRKMRADNPINSPEDITFIDPCMGSGHILVYAFDVLMQIYESCGYNQRDAALLILKKNLYGLDIDKRAYQLAHFSILMKARQYNRRVLSEVKPEDIHVMCFQDAVDINPRHAALWGNTQFNALLNEFRNVDTYGSLLKIKGSYDLDGILHAVETTPREQQIGFVEVPFDKIVGVTSLAKILTSRYDVVCTNPPYMGGSGMDGKLSEFVKAEYPDSKSDLFAAFIEKCKTMAKPTRYFAMITQHAWMFLSSYEKLRVKLAMVDTVNMAHLGPRAFAEIGGEVVQSTMFVMRVSHIHSYAGVYVRLVDYPNAEQKEQEFLSGKNRYTSRAENFTKIPGIPAAYWVSNNVLNAFNLEKISRYISPRIGLVTGDADRFLRYWFEVGLKNVLFNCRSVDESIESKKKWFPYQKGGMYRKWYGNNEFVVNWENDGFACKNDNFSGSRVKSHNYNGEYAFKPAITWTKISSGSFSCRYVPEGYMFDDAGPICSVSEPNILAILALLNSTVTDLFLNIVSPTMNYLPGHINAIPIDYPSLMKCSRVVDICKENLSLAISDWDSYEISWDFKYHLLLDQQIKTLRENFNKWQSFTESRFLQLKSNEEELNRIFIDIYGLQDELTPEVSDKDITVTRIYDAKEDIPENMKGNNYVLTKADVIKSFISYAVGCMFGRYSLDIDGLAYAGGDWDSSKYSRFIPVTDNILLISDEPYYENDIVGRFVEFVRVVYGSETLEENLDFVAHALCGKGNSSRAIIRAYFVKDFFVDHCRTYKKRPIYWQFDSGKMNSFKALIYLHRYEENTVGNLRIDHLHRIQQVYTREIERMQTVIDNGGSGREVTAAEKRKEKLLKQLKETKDYDEKIAHLAVARIAIDLDDGVKVNYDKVQTSTDGKMLDVLTKIK